MRRRCLASLAATGGPTRYRDFCQIAILTLTKLEVQVPRLSKNVVVDDKCVVYVSC